MEHAVFAPEADPVVPGISPQVYQNADFQRIAQLLKAEAGIVLSDKKTMLAYSRLAPLVRSSGRGTFREYLDQVMQDKAERAKLVASLTTNHTYFNREPHHFAHFVETVRDDIIERSQCGEQVRIWSAGSSSGEEIHSLMMYLLGESKSEGQRIAEGKLLVLASDLAAHAVSAARSATYEAEAVNKMPKKLRMAWCNEGTGDAQGLVTIAKVITDLIRYRRLNLLRAWPFDALFDVIFCRNVMIYFDEPTKADLVLRFAQRLKPGGYLYIGHSERVSGPALDLLELVGSTIYKKVSP